MALCDKCGTELATHETHGEYCPSCMYGAFITAEAQREALKRYRQSDKGKEASKRYEQSDKGKAARQKYLKSDKYKAARKRYNAALKESLQIARQALPEHAKALREEPSTQPLIQDINEAIDILGRAPTAAEVRTWGENYGIELSYPDAVSLVDNVVAKRFARGS